MDIIGKRSYFIYYGLLVLVAMFWSTSELVVPPTPIRLAYLVAVFYPVRNNMTALFACQILFYTISYYGLSFFMPSEYYFYFIIYAAFLLINKSQNAMKMPVAMVLLLISSLLVSLINLDTSSSDMFFHRMDGLPQCLIVMLLISGIIDRFDDKLEDYLSYAFIIATLVIALVQLLFGAAFSSDYVGSDFTRNVWTDPNYFGMGVGIGCVVAIIRLSCKQNLPTFEKLFLLGVYVIGLLSILLNASRGAFLAVTIPSVIIILFSDIKKKYKILLICAFAALVVVFNYLHIFDFLLYRIREDDGTGSERTTIWAMKILQFSNLDFLSQLFGIGYHNGLSLGHYVMTHNDYVAFLVEYGYLGLLLFLLLLYYPLRSVKFSAEGFPILLSLTIYVAICSVSLEIYTTGSLVFWFYYLYILYMKQLLKNQEMI